MYLKQQQKTGLFHKYTIMFFLLFLITSCTPSVIKPSTDHKKNILAPIPSSSRLRIDLFVMSQCPYAIEAEKAIIPMIKKLKDRVDFRLYFIAEEENEEFDDTSLRLTAQEAEEIDDYQDDKCHGEFISEGGKFKSLHGKSEIDEDIRQVIIAKYYPGRFLDYLLLRSENYSSDNWEECAAKAWIDCKFINKVAQSDEGEKLFKQNIKRSNEQKIAASPTLFVNGKRQHIGRITYPGIGRIVCKESYVNEFCKTIPICGSDVDCSADGKVGVCVDADKPEAACRFTDPVSFKLIVINPPKECPSCSPENLIVIIKNLFPAAEVTRLENNSTEAKGLIEELGIKILPTFYFDKNITNAARYQKIKDRLSETKDGYLLDPQYLTLSHLLGREKMQGDIKLFVESMSTKAITTEKFLIEAGFMDKFDVDIHYIAGVVNTKEEKKTKLLTVRRDADNPGVLHLQPKAKKIIFKSPKGLMEIKENIRQMCINKYYPAYHIDYLFCINEKLESGEEGIDWRQCLEGEEIDYKKIAFCTNSEEGMNMLLQDIAFIEEIGISRSPTYLVNNTILLRNIDPVSFEKIYSELTHGKE